MNPLFRNKIPPKPNLSDTEQPKPIERPNRTSVVEAYLSYYQTIDTVTAFTSNLSVYPVETTNSISSSTVPSLSINTNPHPYHHHLATSPSLHDAPDFLALANSVYSHAHTTYQSSSRSTSSSISTTTACFDLVDWDTELWIPLKYTSLWPSLDNLTPVRPLGEGAFGRVWLASLSSSISSSSPSSVSSPNEQLRTSISIINDLSSTHIAVKQLSLSEVTMTKQAHRAGRELRVLCMVSGYRGGNPYVYINSNPNTNSSLSSLSLPLLRTLVDKYCVQLRGAAYEHNYLYLFMEPLFGGTLLDIICKNNQHIFPSNTTTTESIIHQSIGPCIPIKNAQFYLSSILLGLIALHDRGIMYRDLKLDNICLGEDGYTRLIDFGFARSVYNYLYHKEIICHKCQHHGDTFTMLLPDTIPTITPSSTESNKPSDPLSTVLVSNDSLSSTLRCCECSCVHIPSSKHVPHLSDHLHHYHSPSESVVHMHQFTTVFKERLHGIPIVPADDTKVTSITTGKSKTKVPSLSTTNASSSTHSPLPNVRARAGSFVGSIEYMAPEISNSTGHNESADIWSFGVVAYELFTGVSPFTGLPVHKDAENNSNDADYDRDTQKQHILIGRRANKGEYTIPLWLEETYPLAVQLLKDVLQPDANQRPCIHQLLFHPFFTGIEEKNHNNDVEYKKHTLESIWLPLLQRKIIAPSISSVSNPSTNTVKESININYPTRFGKETYEWNREDIEDDDNNQDNDQDWLPSWDKSHDGLIDEYNE